MRSNNENLNRLSCLGENEFGIEQSRLYQVNFAENSSAVILPVLFAVVFLIGIFSIVAFCCACRSRQRKKRSMKTKKLPIVYDAHYSINELIKDVGQFRTSDLRTCNTSLNDTDQLSLKIDQNKIESTGLTDRRFFSMKNFFFRRSFVDVTLRKSKQYEKINR